MRGENKEATILAYDTIKMLHKDDFWAYTVEGAERAGYRRAKKWFGE